MELPDVPLFRGLTADEAEAAVTALRMRRRAFAKGEILLEAGQRAPALGVVLAGRVHMEHLDVWGSKTLLGQAGPGDLFAETYACLPDEPLRVSVVAAENGEALFLETGQLLQCGCEPWRWKLTQNLLRIAARKNLGLAQRSLYTAPKTIRGRITAYFSMLARHAGQGICEKHHGVCHFFDQMTARLSLLHQLIEAVFLQCVNDLASFSQHIQPMHRRVFRRIIHPAKRLAICLI